MMKTKFRYIYGPVFSWRLGRSLGIDLLSQEDKICNFDCVYCQLGKTRRYVLERKLWIQTGQVLEELTKLPRMRIDTITFSGRGESTLALNLGRTIKEIKKVHRCRVTVITNSSLMNREDVRKELAQADSVLAKLDAYSDKSFFRINHPAENIQFSRVLNGIKLFRKNYKGKLALQVMFLKSDAASLDFLTKFINRIVPDEVQVNTPLRACPVKPLPKADIQRIKETIFNRCISHVVHERTRIISCYDKSVIRKKFAVSGADTLKRRGKE